MPYKKVSRHPDCGEGEIAVVSPSGKVLGCHKTDASADEQIAALNAKENNSLHWVDRYSADKVLSGDPVLLLPLMPGGYHRWGVKSDPITHDVLQTILANFMQRSQIGGIVGNIPLNVEHDEISGKIGLISNLEMGDDGLYAYFELTPKGQELLGDDAFDYLSPEIVWSFQDIETGQDVGPVLVGAAVTNYPFFGEKTAMYSQAAAARLTERLSGSGPAEDAGSGDADQDMDLIVRVTSMVRGFGIEMSDLESWGDHPALAISRLALVLDKPEHTQFHYTLALCDLQPAGEAGYFPRSAFLYHRGAAGEWEYRIKGKSGYRLELDGRLVRAARDAIGEQDPGAIERHSDLFAVFAREDEMPDNEQIVSVEEFNTVREQAEAMSRRIDELTNAVAERDGQIHEMRTQNVIDRFSREAEQFAAIGVEVNEYAAHFAWLQGADPEGTHLEWFRTVITTADQALAQSDAFRERGRQEDSPSADPFSRIVQLMETEAENRGVTLRAGTKEYAEIMADVMRANPDLAERYRAGLINQPSEPPPQ